MKVLLLLELILAIPVIGWSRQISPAPDPTLTLDQAIALAMSENHLVREAEIEVSKAGDVLAATRTSRLPSM